LSANHIYGNGIRKLEYLIEGDASAQRLLKNSPEYQENCKNNKTPGIFPDVIHYCKFFLAYIRHQDLWKIITEP
jgi:hypothetical protein